VPDAAYKGRPIHPIEAATGPALRVSTQPRAPRSPIAARSTCWAPICRKCCAPPAPTAWSPAP